MFDLAFYVSTLSTNEKSWHRAAAGRIWKNEFRKTVRAIIFNPTCASIIYIHPWVWPLLVKLVEPIWFLFHLTVSPKKLSFNRGSQYLLIGAPLILTWTRGEIEKLCNKSCRFCVFSRQFSIELSNKSGEESSLGNY